MPTEGYPRAAEGSTLFPGEHAEAFFETPPFYLPCTLVEISQQSSIGGLRLQTQAGSHRFRLGQGEHTARPQRVQLVQRQPIVCPDISGGQEDCRREPEASQNGSRYGGIVPIA